MGTLKKWLFWIGMSGCVFPFKGQSQTEVAWLEFRTPQGQIVQLEPDFFYAHVAIKVDHRWLHANPRSGVEIISTEKLEKLGKIKEVLVSFQDEFDFSSDGSSFLNKPFDHEYSWSDDKIYCAELVAKMLKISPSPMHFDEQFWPPFFQKYEGLPGASPAKLYRELKRRGYFNPELP